MTVSPEEIGLCGCWQVLAVRRERVELGRKAKPPGDELGDYVTSRDAPQLGDAELLEAMRDPWSALENGAPHRRAGSFGEDARGVSPRGAAQVLAARRHRALGIYELEKERGRTKSPSAPARCRPMTFTAALALLRR